MNTQVKYIKPFSKGQITIPKEFREAYGIDDRSWLKVTTDKGKLILEPIKKEFNREEWAKKILSIKGVWDLRTEIKKSRAETEKKLQKYGL